MDFCGTRTCDLRISTLMLCHLSQGARPAGMATSRCPQEEHFLHPNVTYSDGFVDGSM